MRRAAKAGAGLWARMASIATAFVAVAVALAYFGLAFIGFDAFAGRREQELYRPPPPVRTASPQSRQY